MLASIILFIETAYIQADQLPNINIDVKKRYIIFFLSETTFLNRFHFLKNNVVNNKINAVHIHLWTTTSNAPTKVMY